MTISFAGVPLLLDDPTGEVERFIANWWHLPTNVINCPPRTIDTRSLCQVPNWPECPRLKLNQLYVPSGATRWTRGLFLTDDLGMDQLYGTAYGEFVIGTEYLHTIAGPACPSSSTAQDGPKRAGATAAVIDPATEWDIGDVYKTILFKLDPIPISIKNVIPSSSSSMRGNYLYIIPLVDERYYWQGVNTVSTSTQWVPDTWSSSTSSSGFGRSKRGLLGDIASALSVGALGNPNYWDYISGSWLANGKPSYLAFRNGPIPAAGALDLLAWSQNLLLVPDHTNGTPFGGSTVQTYKLIGNGVYFAASSSSSSSCNWLTPQNLVQGQKNAADWTMGPGHMAGNEHYQTGFMNGRQAGAFDYPTSIQMMFTSPTSLSQQEYVKETFPPRGFGPTGGTGGGIMRVKCLATADNVSVSDNVATPSNQIDLDNIANTWSQNWYRNFFNQFDYSFNNMPILRFCGVEDYILYDMSYKRSRPDKYTAATRWVSLPGNFGYEYIAIETDVHKDDIVVVPTTGTGTCAGCPCFDCITDAQAVITSSSCAYATDGAPMYYDIFVGDYVYFPTLGGQRRFKYGFTDLDCSTSSSHSVSRSSSITDSCTWSTCLIYLCYSPPSPGSTSCGLYQWQLLITAEGEAEFRLQFLDGTDVLPIYGT